MSRHLFLGGSKHGQILDVENAQDLYLIPVPDPYPFRYDDARVPLVIRHNYETYLREHQGMPDPHARTVAVYVLAGASMAREFTRWLHETLQETSEDTDGVEAPVPRDAAVDTSPYIQISVVGRTVRWNVEAPVAALILQSIVQAHGPGEEVS